MTALHQILKVDAELPSLELVRPLRLHPLPCAHSICDRPCNPGRDTVLDLFVEFPRGIALRLLEARVARKEDIGEVVVARIGDRRDIHAPQEERRIVRCNSLRRLLQCVRGTLDIVGEIPRKHQNRHNDQPRRKLKLSRMCLAPPCQPHAPRKLIHRHRRTSLYANPCHYSIEYPFAQRRDMLNRMMYPPKQ